MKRKGPQRDLRKQRFWEGAVRQWRQSGLSVRQYCRQNSLSEPSFYAWRRELARRRQAASASGRSGASRAAAATTGPRRKPLPSLAKRSAAPSPRKPQRRSSLVGQRPDERPTAAFLPVRVVQDAPAETAGVDILLQRGRTVRVRAGFDPQALAGVLAVLEGRSC